MKDRSLILFTLFSQTSVGAYLSWLAGSWQFLPESGGLNTDHLALAQLALVLLLAMAGLAASLSHLGSPGNAWRAVANLRQSWLSREILFALAYLGCLVVYLFLRLFDLGNWPWRAAVLLAAALGGLGMVYSMARIYMQRTIPAWNSRLTLLSFLAATFLLGSLFFGTTLAVQSVWMNFKQAFQALGLLRLLASLALFWLLVEFVLIPLNLIHLARLGVPQALGWPLSQLYIFRLSPLFGGVALAGAIFSSAQPVEATGALGAGLAFSLVFLSEAFGRWLFYASRQPAM
ncbi:MAG: dimethyl sulfoxide reductase anchor subunit [Anaerolineales bacterium]|jgi:anaerobic dimethyl sulfoxide reductase subunit C (anchor subunit)|nr:dimethyl sulfoxide reductase anchor subunit [Anaerolineales bacterium]